MASEQKNNALLWLVIGGIIVAIGLTFTVIFSVIFSNQITDLSTTCENNGEQPIVKKNEFILLFSYSFECDR